MLGLHSPHPFSLLPAASCLRCLVDSVKLLKASGSKMGQALKAHTVRDSPRTLAAVAAPESWTLAREGPAPATVPGSQAVKAARALENWTWMKMSACWGHAILAAVSPP